MITLKLKTAEEDISISWSDEENLKKVISRQTSNFGKEHTLSNNEVISESEFEYQEALNFILNNIQLPYDSTIIDIGSGTSIIDLVLYKYLQGRANFYLVDGDSMVNGGHEFLYHKDFQPFNDWAPVLDAINTNSFDRSKFTFVHPEDDWKTFKQADVILSNCSYGLHYPLDVYLDRVHSTLKPGGFLILRPFLNINEPIKILNSLYGDPIYLDKVPMSLIETLRPNDYERWKMVFSDIKSTELWGYKGVWQKPYK